MNEKLHGTAGPASSQAGQLEVVVPDETLIAGQLNSISFVLRNPYAVPITVTEVTGPSSHSVTAVSSREVNENGRASFSTLTERLVRYWTLPIASIAVAGIQIETPQRPKRVVNVRAEPNSRVKFDEDIGPFTALNIEAEEGAVIEIGKRPVDDTPEVPEFVVIPPGGQRVFTILIKTAQWLLFTPRRFPINIQLGFEIDGEPRSQVVVANISINPPLTSIICGSVAGGALGALARALQKPAQLNAASAVQGIAAIVMSIIAAIMLSRKTGAQSFITVEDFFGAFAIGALIGYGGAEYFQRAVLPATSESIGETP